MAILAECPECRKRQLRRIKIKDGLIMAALVIVMYFFYKAINIFIFGGLFSF